MRIHRPAVAIAAVLVAALAAPSQAAPPSATAPLPAVVVEPTASSADELAPGETYRGALALVDAVAAGAIVIGVATDGDATAVVGLGGLFLAAPLAHLVAGNPESGAASFGLRFGLPLTGLLVGYGLDVGLGVTDGASYIALGAGAAAALVIDYVHLARTPRRARRERSLALTPVASPGGLGLAGRF